MKKHLLKFAVLLTVLTIFAFCKDKSTDSPDNNNQDTPLDGRGGGIILFSRTATAANHNLYVMNADGSALKRLTNYVEGAFAGDWSPDGTKIAYYAHDEMEEWSIYTMNSDGSDRELILNRQGIRCHQPSWSPDGTRIVYGAETDENLELWMMNADGNNPVRIEGASGRCPDWSPDGTKIVFQSYWDPTSEIYTVNIDGTGLTQLTDNNALDGWPEWSPDGTQIVFVSNRDGNQEIYVMNADGTGQTRLTNNSNDDAEPKWSPDGTKIVFCYWTDDTNGYDIVVIDADGSNRQNLTQGTAYDIQPAWK
ncbi:DUF5050 domain-containing protein [candidate division KSB1 bacterium]